MSNGLEAEMSMLNLCSLSLCEDANSKWLYRCTQDLP